MIAWWWLIPAGVSCAGLGLMVGGWNRANAAASRDEERRGLR